MFKQTKNNFKRLSQMVLLIIIQKPTNKSKFKETVYEHNFWAANIKIIRIEHDLYVMVDNILLQFKMIWSKVTLTIMQTYTYQIFTVYLLTKYEAILFSRIIEKLLSLFNILKTYSIRIQKVDI